MKIESRIRSVRRAFVLVRWVVRNALDLFPKLKTGLTNGLYDQTW
jgi:hypothetical protein